MPDRDHLIHNVGHWEDLLHTNDPFAILPPGVTAENPLKLLIEREVLTTQIKKSLASIAANREALDTTPEAKADTDGLVAQCLQMIGWLVLQAADHVFVSLHPISEFGRVNEDEEVVEDEDSGGEEDEGAPEA